MVAGKQVLVDNPFVVTPFRGSHYAAVFRLQSRPYALSKTATLNTRNQFAVVQHAATAVKTAYLRKCSFHLESVSAAGLYVVELHHIVSAAATGNPAITPAAMKRGPACEATALALPTTPGNELNPNVVIASREFNVAATGTAPTTSPPAALNETVLFEYRGEGQEPPTLRPGFLEGWAVTVDVNVSSTVVKCFVRMEFWEE